MEAQDNRNQYDKARKKEVIPFLITLLIQSIILLITVSISSKFFTEFQDGTVGPPLLIKMLVLIFPLSMVYSIISSTFNLLKKLKGIDEVESKREPVEYADLYINTEKSKLLKILAIIFSCFIDFIFIAFLVGFTITFVKEGVLEVIPITSLFLFIIVRSASYGITKKILNK